jgi:Ni/Fe-hydrogenase subunit HybB-like protein
MAFHGITPEMPVYRIESTPRALRIAIPVLIVLGVIVFIAALLTDVERAWRAYHMNWLYFTSIAQGGFMLAVVTTIAKGMWSRPIRRIALAFSAFLPIAYLLVIPIFIGAEHIFPWIHHPVAGKDVYLNVPFMVVRQLLGLGIMFTLSLVFAYWALRPDLGQLRDQVPERLRGLYGRMTVGWRGQEAEELLAHRRLTVLAPAVAIAYAVGMGVMSWDFVMSLEPHWFSTLIGPYVFMGAFLGGLMTIAIITVIVLRRLNMWDVILPTTLHDLGKLCFGFTIFWAYLFFSQFIVIWYAKFPHEQAFIVHRFVPPFRLVSQIVGTLLFVVPFFGLMGVKPKKTPLILMTFAIISLVGLWLERYILVYPSLYIGTPVLPIGWQEFGMALPFAGLFLASLMWFMTRFPLFQLWIPASELELEGLEVPHEAPQDTDRVISRDL